MRTDADSNSEQEGEYFNARSWRVRALLYISLASAIVLADRIAHQVWWNSQSPGAMICLALACCLPYQSEKRLRQCPGSRLFG